MSTISQREISPTSDLSKIFTTVYAVLSKGMFAAVIAKRLIFTVAHKNGAKQHKTHSAEKSVYQHSSEKDYDHYGVRSSIFYELTYGGA